jgi:Na+-driven multidrug efflux pump
MTLLIRDMSQEIGKLAYPIVLGSVAQSLLNTADTIMLGRLSPAALTTAGMEIATLI